MCEFDVIIDGKILFEDAVYAKVEKNDVTVRNVIGESRRFEKCKIVEVDVNSTRLVLSTSKE